MELINAIKKIMFIWEGSYINNKFELILDEKENIYTDLNLINNSKDLMINMFEWKSRNCLYSNDFLNKFNLLIGKNYTYEDYDILYKKVGNGVNIELANRFYDSGYELESLFSNYDNIRNLMKSFNWEVIERNDGLCEVIVDTRDSKKNLILINLNINDREWSDIKEELAYVKHQIAQKIITRNNKKTKIQDVRYNVKYGLYNGKILRYYKIVRLVYRKGQFTYENGFIDYTDEYNVDEIDNFNLLKEERPLLYEWIKENIDELRDKVTERAIDITTKKIIKK